MSKEKFCKIDNPNIIATFKYGDFIVEVEIDRKNDEATFWISHKILNVKLGNNSVKNARFFTYDDGNSVMVSVLFKIIDEMICEYMTVFGNTIKDISENGFQTTCEGYIGID